jgi:hypothetical protein
MTVRTRNVRVFQRAGRLMVRVLVYPRFAALLVNRNVPVTVLIATERMSGEVAGSQDLDVTRSPRKTANDLYVSRTPSQVKRQRP